MQNSNNGLLTFALIFAPPISPTLAGSLNFVAPFSILSPFTSSADTFFNDISKLFVVMTKSSDGTKRVKNASLIPFNFPRASFTNYDKKRSNICRHISFNYKLLIQIKLNTATVLVLIIHTRPEQIK